MHCWDYTGPTHCSSNQQTFEIQACPVEVVDAEATVAKEVAYLEEQDLEAARTGSKEAPVEKTFARLHSRASAAYSWIVKNCSDKAST